MTSEDLPVASLILLPEMQVRAKTDPKVTEEYRRAMAAGAAFPPIRVARLDGAMVLVDGFHRVAALRALHRADVQAEVVEVASLGEARWEAARANLTHGLRLKPGDRREVFRAYVKAAQHRHGGRKRGRLKSYREMATDLPGFAHTSIRNWMRKDFPSVYGAMGGGEEKGWAPGGLPLEPSPAVAFAREAREGIRQAAAALPGIDDGRLRGELLEQVEALRDAVLKAGVESTAF